MQKSLAAGWQIIGNPGLAHANFIQLDYVDVGQIARREYTSIIQAVNLGGVSALALNRLTQAQPEALSISYPVLQHEGGRCCVANSPAVRAAIRQRVNAVIGLKDRFQEIQIAVRVVEQWEVDEPSAAVTHQ